jgi:hypothetical protein
MRKFTFAATAALAVLLLAGMGSSVYAINFSVDVPVAGDATIKGSGGGSSTSFSYSGLSGYRVGAGIGWLGLGYEAYEGKTDLSKTIVPADFKLKSTFTDVEIQFPIPFMNLALGYGVGGIKGDCSLGCKIEWDATQYYLTVGLPIAKVWDVHVGYHAISASGKADSSGSKPGDIDSTVYFVGARVGW